MHTTLRKYVWAPRDEVVYLQAIIDAYEGLGRVRTEKHDGDRSLLLLMIDPSREGEFFDLLRHLSSELRQPLENI